MISKTRMLELVKSLSWREVENGLDEKPDLIAYRDKRGRSWLHLCCGVPVAQRALNPKDSIKLAGLLLQRGLDLNEPAFTEDQWHATPLWYAIGWGRNLPLATYLLKRGADPNHCLWAAAFNRDVPAIKLLAAHGAAIDAVAEDATPFLFAVAWSHFEAAEALLKLGANPNVQDSKQRTALHCMLKKGSDLKHFKMLLKYGARGDIVNKEGATAAQIMLKKRDPEFRRMGEKLHRGSSG